VWLISDFSALLMLKTVCFRRRNEKTGAENFFYPTENEYAGEEAG
jgi:hypothetical protein